MKIELFCIKKQMSEVELIVQTRIKTRENGFQLFQSSCVLAQEVKWNLGGFAVKHIKMGCVLNE